MYIKCFNVMYDKIPYIEYTLLSAVENQSNILRK